MARPPPSPLGRDGQGALQGGDQSMLRPLATAGGWKKEDVESAVAMDHQTTPSRRQGRQAAEERNRGKWLQLAAMNNAEIEDIAEEEALEQV